MNIDTIIESFQRPIAEIEYMRTVYGRAMTFQEQWADGELVQVPKVRLEDNEYVVPLPVDLNEPIVFFQAVGTEQYDQFDRDNIGGINRQIALTWWGKIDVRSLESVKFDVISVLQGSGYVSSIDTYVDERYQDVFPDFLPYLSVREREQSTQWLMAPWGGFRLTFTVSYGQIMEGCDDY